MKIVDKYNFFSLLSGSSANVCSKSVEENERNTTSTSKREAYLEMFKKLISKSDLLKNEYIF